MTRDSLDRILGGLDELLPDGTGREYADILWLAAQLLRQADVSPSKIARVDDVGSEASSAPAEAAAPSFEFDSPAADGRIASGDESENEERAGPATADVFLPIGAVGPTRVRSGRRFRAPLAAALPSRLALVRALRPLMRRVPSRTAWQLAEEETVQRIAAGDLWVPTMRPAPERWFTATLVVDSSLSMGVWRQTARELRELFLWAGAFRELRTLQWKADGDRTELTDLRGKPASPVAGASDGRRLILVFSDCVSRAWWNGSAFRWLEEWSKRAIVGLIQPLPEPLWSRTALGRAQRVRLSSRTSAAPNRAFDADVFDDWDDRRAGEGLRLPVAMLEPSSFEKLADLIAGPSRNGAPGLVVPRDYVPGSPDATRRTLTPDDRLAQFRQTASPLAQRLAGLVAASPALSLQVIRHIRQAMLPEAQQVHEAELLLGGLLYALRDPQPELLGGDDLAFAFFEGVADRLLDSVPVPDWTQVLSRVSECLERRLDELRGFRAFLEDPTAPVEEMAVSEHPFVRLAASRLARLGGPYARWAGKRGGRAPASRTAATRTNVSPDVTPPVPPVDPASSPAPGANAAQTADPAVARPRILVVDDSLAICLLVRQALEQGENPQSDNWRVETATDGLEALEAVLRSPPALVVSGWLLPSMDGLELLRAVRAADATRLLPFILMSSNDSTDLAVEAMRCGADDFILKRDLADRLKASVQKLLESAAEQNASESRSALDGLAPNAPQPGDSDLTLTSDGDLHSGSSLDSQAPKPGDTDLTLDLGAEPPSAPPAAEDSGISLDLGEAFSLDPLDALAADPGDSDIRLNLDDDEIDLTGENRSTAPADSGISLSLEDSGIQLAPGPGSDVFETDFESKPAAQDEFQLSLDDDIALEDDGDQVISLDDEEDDKSVIALDDDDDNVVGFDDAPLDEDDPFEDPPPAYANVKPKTLDEAVQVAQRLVQDGYFHAARKRIQAIAGQSSELTAAKQRWLEQVAEAEEKWQATADENSAMERGILRASGDRNYLKQVAAQGNLDRRNVYLWNAVLRELAGQLGVSVPKSSKVQSTRPAPPPPPAAPPKKPADCTLQILGPPQAAKSSWLTTCYHLLRNQVEKLPIQLSPLVDESRLLDQLVSGRLAGSVPPTTRTDEPIVLKLEATGRRRRFGFWREVRSVVEVVDGDAEALIDPKSARVTLDALKKAHGALLFVDLQRLHELKRYVYELRQLQEVAKSLNRRSMPWAICLTKLDTAAGRIAPLIESLDRTYDTPITLELIAHRSTACRGFLETSIGDMSSVLGEFEATLGKNFRFFPISTAGWGRRREPEHDAPFGVLEPLFWLLHQTGHGTLS